MISDLDKPTINSADTRPAEGTTMNISCIVDGQPTPTISWTMNGSPLKTSENSEIFLRNNNKQLTIMNRQWRIPMCGDEQSWKCFF